MKKAIFFLSVWLGMTGNLWSQNCAPRGVKTDPISPVNTHRPSMVNTFNYTAQNFPVNLASTQYNATQVPSPFYTTDNSGINHFYDPQDGIKDNTPIQGWELIKMDFGFDEFGNPKNPGVNNPYLILYNRYTGILRIFVMRVEGQPYNGVQVNIKFEINSAMQTSLLDHNAELKAISGHFTSDPELNSVAEFLTLPFKWFYADFPMIYDPCTCLFQSNLKIEVMLTNTSQINATIITEGSLTAQGKPTSAQKAKGSFSIGDLKNKTKAAIQVYKNSNIFKDDIKKYLSSSGPSPTEQDKFYFFYNELKNKNFLKSGLSSIPYLEDAINIIDFFTGGAKKGPSTVQITPMSINLKSSFTGTIVGSYLYNSISFRTPGSSIPSYVPNSEYPYYNEVMGIFNLLKTAKLNMKQYIKSGGGGGGGSPWGGGGGGSGYTLQSFFQLSEDIQYVLNPASGLQIEEIKMALVGDSEFLALNGNQYGQALSSAGRSEIRKRNEYRSAYKSIECFKQTVFKLEKTVSSAYAYNNLNSNNLRIKVMVNLKRKDGEPDAQNVLFVATYPVSLTPSYGISASEATSLNNASYGFSYCGSWNLPNMVSPSAVQSFCNSSQYKHGARGFKNGEYERRVISMNAEEQKQSIKMGLMENGSTIQIFPNPSYGIITMNYLGQDSGPISIYITDIRGKRILDVAHNESMGLGKITKTLDTRFLSPGIYFSVFETNSGRRLKKFQVIHE